MNIDPNKIKKLVLAFSELDEQYQDELLQKAYELRLMQIEKDHIKKEGISFKRDEDFRKEIIKRTNESAKEAMDLLNILKEANDTEKASVIMLMKQMVSKSNAVWEPDISITVNQKEISMKEYLEKYFSSVDYYKVKSMVEEHMNTIGDRK